MDVAASPAQLQLCELFAKIEVSRLFAKEGVTCPLQEGTQMRNAIQLMKKLKQDEEGAALVEYTVLLGIMLVAVIATIGLVGGWMSTKWTALWNALSTN